MSSLDIVLEKIMNASFRDSSWHEYWLTFKDWTDTFSVRIRVKGSLKLKFRIRVRVRVRVKVR